MTATTGLQAGHGQVAGTAQATAEASWSGALWCTVRGSPLGKAAGI